MKKRLKKTRGRSRFLAMMLTCFLVICLFTGCNSTASTEDSTEDSTETATEESTEKSTEESAEKSTEDTTEDTTEASNAEYPTNTIEIIVGFSAGGGNHTAALNLTANAEDVFNQSVIVTCMPGGSSAVANSYVANEDADGYTLLNATLSLPISMYVGSVDFEKEDFLCVGMFSSVTPCLVVSADFPADTLEELEQYISENPGEVTWSHSGVYSTLHIAGCAMFDSMGVYEDVTAVGYDGTSEAITAVLSGECNAVISFPSSVSEQVKAGNLKVLGVNAETDILPDVQTFEEQGYDCDLTSTRGIFVRNDTPQYIIDYLEESFATIIKSDEFKEAATSIGEPPVYMNSEDGTECYYEQCDLIAQMISDLGLVD